MKSLKEGDTNTKFFHARASCRQRMNRIAAITVDGTVLVNHAAKSEAMTNYYTSILGVADDTRWNFDVATLYPVTHAAALADLVAPFSEGEALNAVKSMNINSAPGPDGFGLAWYVTAWTAIKDDILSFLSSFYNGTVDLDRINRAYIVLLPKCQGATAPKDFRPVSL